MNFKTSFVKNTINIWLNKCYINIIACEGKCLLAIVVSFQRLSRQNKIVHIKESFFNKKYYLKLTYFKTNSTIIFQKYNNKIFFKVKMIRFNRCDNLLIISLSLISRQMIAHISAWILYNLHYTGVWHIAALLYNGYCRADIPQFTVLAWFSTFHGHFIIIFLLCECVNASYSWFFVYVKLIPQTTRNSLTEFQNV